MSEDMRRADRYDRDDEGSAERLDRQWNELLQELRLAQTGTQILFAWFVAFWYVVPALIRRASEAEEQTSTGTAVG